LVRRAVARSSIAAPSRPSELSIMPRWKANRALRAPAEVALSDQVTASAARPFAISAQA